MANADAIKKADRDHRPLADAPAPILEISNLVKTYPGTRALDGIRLAVAKNEILGLAGHNGAGKSTLTRIIAGAERPDAGEIMLSGRNVRFRCPDDATTWGIAQVPQPLMIIPNLTGRENLLLGMHRRRHSGDRGGGAPAWFGGSSSAVEAVGLLAEQLHLTEYLDVKIGRVRPVTQRLIMIGRALLRSPELIILDEPTANLPRPEVDLLFSIIRPLARARASVIYITHRLDEMLELADRIVVMRQGRVIAEKSASETDKAALSALIAGTDLSPQLRALVAGVDVHGQAPGSPPTPRDSASVAPTAEVLRCENLSAKPRLHDIDLVLHRGEVLGVAGLDGSGRTSLLRTLWGDRQILGGRIMVRGEAVELTSPRKAIALGLAYLPEERASNAIFPGMNITENATLPRLWRFVGIGGFLSGRKEVADVSVLLERLDLRPLKGAARAKIRTLSGGNQQKVIIARWLLGHADIFMFDEPTQGIDVGAREQVYEVIRELAEQGAGIIVVSSEAEELARLCSVVHVMRDGSIVQTLTGDDATEPKISQATVVGGIGIARGPARQR
jgi:ribose transport system ATP-binding protein